MLQSGECIQSLCSYSYFGYATFRIGKIGPEFPLGQAKLIAKYDNLARSWSNYDLRLQLLDKFKVFFDIPLNHLNGSAIFVPYLNSTATGKYDFCKLSRNVGGVARARAYAKLLKLEMVSVTSTENTKWNCFNGSHFGMLKGKERDF